MRIFIKHFFLGTIFSLFSLLMMLIVSSSGVVVINGGYSATIDYDAIATTDELEGSNQRALAAIEQSIGDYKKLSFKEKLAIHKNYSWFITWVPWLFLPFFLNRFSYLYLGCTVIPVVALVVVEFLWVRELLLIGSTLLAVVWIKTNRKNK